MKRTKFNAIECKICGKKFIRITNTHLWKEHKITIEEYKQKYPNALLDAKGLAKSRVTHLSDKSYEEIYGEEKALILREKRSKAAIAQMKDPLQIKIREETTHDVAEITKERLSLSHTKHGYSTYRKRALSYYGLECERCGYTSENPADFIAHHRDLNNIPGELGNHAVENLMVLCKSCHGKLHNELSEGIKRFTGIKSVEKGVHYILKGLKDDFGLDLYDENFKDTPKRVARAYAEIFSGIKDTDKQVKEILNTAFPCEFDEMIISKNVEVFSMCPHHLLPVHYKISVGYITTPQLGKVIGISKLARLVEILAKRPVLQEKLTMDITKALMSLEGCRGAACIVDGQHYCMIMRGAKQSQSHTMTSSMVGAFFTSSAARMEFTALLRD